MKRIVLFPRVLLLLLTLGTVNAAERLPHIVLLIGDDHGFPYFGFMGDEHVVTPAMDTLAEGGLLFTEAHVTTPYCRPSLRSMITGLHPVTYVQRKNQIVKERREMDPDWGSLNKTEKQMWKAVETANAMKSFDTLPKLLREKGYVSWQGGKWWENGYDSGHFDEGMTDGWDMKKFGTDDFFHEMMGSDGTELGRTTMAPLFDFIDRQQDKPMFIWYGPMLPHTPYDAPDKFKKFYEHKDISESAKQYYSNITWWDDGVSQLMDYMGERDLLENTLFIYLSDNGWEQDADVEYWYEGVTVYNDSKYSTGGFQGKGGNYDSSYRTPLIFYWKDKIHGTVNQSSLVSSLDLVPTILDIVGLENPEELPGRSLKPLLRGDSYDERTELIGYTDNQRSETSVMGEIAEKYYVRTHRWHFMYSATSGEKELYDVTVDYQAKRNLVEDYDHLVPGFMEKVEAWRAEMGMDGRVAIAE
ncbi:sulfatase family protein [Pelagicoccus mobilis]|uniref:Sulfatase-like hydrolase/transferase n=1 Tax=Pelagicoccus mobilis TaxID=415221 RepID=A0A934S2M8_9BACT|nr:sulfatase-like hydrolase/transferase [Pelagicoccus mobilis]MBK1878712.1 sulfatase-like hydrolase/transferase [Pelagicoccus mobilis]